MAVEAWGVWPLSAPVSWTLMLCNCEDALLISVVAAWPNSPNFLLVDYYNLGSSPGSVFQVAAQHNNVTYNRPCCGLFESAACSLRSSGSLLMTMAVSGSLVLLLS